MPKVYPCAFHDDFKEDCPYCEMLDTRRGNEMPRRQTMKIDALKNLSDRLNRLDLDEIVELLTDANTLKQTYDAQGVPAPDWLAEAISQLQVETKARRRDAIQAKLKQARLRKEGLKSMEQKRSETEAEIAALEAELAK